MELLTLLALANLVVGVLIFSVLRSINQGLSLSRAEHPLPFSAQELLEQKMRTEAEARKAVALSEQVTDKWGGKKLESSADELALRLEQLEVEWQENRHSHEVMRYALMIRANFAIDTIIVMFGVFVCLTMVMVIRLHKYNQSREDSLHLIGIEKH